MNNTLSRLAGQLCAQPAFQRWLGATTSEQAAEAVRARCGIQSRRELDTNPDAARRFHAIRRGFAYGEGE
ncbi:hypothetical protein GCM10023144_01440 [Pigmentiphaga soli]|uniref:Uncharacterized protein n=1 Tax=Pigmentiphaga soli TaxID=1007095 RepID=A0ABP8GCL0_9BURK